MDAVTVDSSDGSVYICGLGGESAGSWDAQAYVSRYTSLGSELHTKLLGAQMNSAVSMSVTLSPNGMLFVSGATDVRQQSSKPALGLARDSPICGVSVQSHSC